MPMPIKMLALAAAMVLPILTGFARDAQAQVKTAKSCDDEYKTQKAALKAAKETKKDFIAACRALPAGTPTPVGGSVAAAPAPRSAPVSPSPTSPSPASPATAPAGSVKTAGACEDEYKANKGALKSAKEKKKDFIAACRALPAGQPTPIGAATAPVSPAAPTPKATVPPSTAPAAPAAPPPAPAAPVPSTPAAPAPASRPRAQTRAPGTTDANGFPAEAAAKARCPGATVVWVNTSTKIYHFAGTKNYGTTKAGAYMCESDAQTSGARASETEKHP